MASASPMEDSTANESRYFSAQSECNRRILLNPVCQQAVPTSKSCYMRGNLFAFLTLIHTWMVCREYTLAD